MAHTLRSWAQQARQASREEFLRRFPGPFLVVIDALELMGPQSIVSTAKLPALRKGQTGKVPAADGLLVHAVAKRPDGQSPFPAMITVGRMANNDIVLAAPDVSTFHAYFAREGDAWVVRDADSTHGTTIGGLKITGPTRVAPDTPIMFGNIRTRFVDAAGLFKAALFGL